MNKFVTTIRRNENNDIVSVGYDDELLNPVIGSLYRNNTFCPSIKNIIVNGPVTKCFFVDGTSVVIKRSANDPDCIDAAIAHCLVKRLLGKPDENGNIVDSGYGSFLRKTVEEKVFHQDKYEAEQKAKRRARQNAQRIAEEKKAKPAPKKSSVKKSLNRSANGRFSKKA